MVYKLIFDTYRTACLRIMILLHRYDHIGMKKVISVSIKSVNNININNN
jgi:hypothetical protein